MQLTQDSTKVTKFGYDTFLKLEFYKSEGVKTQQAMCAVSSKLKMD